MVSMNDRLIRRSVLSQQLPNTRYGVDRFTADREVAAQEHQRARAPRQHRRDFDEISRLGRIDELRLHVERDASGVIARIPGRLAKHRIGKRHQHAEYHENQQPIDPHGEAGLQDQPVQRHEPQLVVAAHAQPLIREFTTATAYAVELPNGRHVYYNNSNGLVKNAGWTIGLSKTGYISEAGRCLVMQSRIASLPVVIVLLDSWGRNTRMGDANRIKKWMESMFSRQPAG